MYSLGSTGKDPRHLSGWERSEREKGLTIPSAPVMLVRVAGSRKAHRNLRELVFGKPGTHGWQAGCGK